MDSSGNSCNNLSALYLKSASPIMAETRTDRYDRREPVMKTPVPKEQVMNWFRAYTALP